MIEGEMGAAKQKKVSKVCTAGALGEWGGEVLICKLQVKVSARDGRTLWDCGRDKEKGRGGPSALPRLFAGPVGESWQDADSLDPSTGSGGHTVFMENLGVGGECCGPSKKINCLHAPTAIVKNKQFLECPQKFLD